MGLWAQQSDRAPHSAEPVPPRGDRLLWTARLGRRLPAGLQGLLETDPLRISDAVLALSTVVIGWAVARITHGFRGARVAAPGASSIRILAEEEVKAK